MVLLVKSWEETSFRIKIAMEQIYHRFLSRPPSPPVSTLSQGGDLMSPKSLDANVNWGVSSDTRKHGKLALSSLSPEGEANKIWNDLDQ